MIEEDNSNITQMILSAAILAVKLGAARGYMDISCYERNVGMITQAHNTKTRVKWDATSKLGQSR